MPKTKIDADYYHKVVDCQWACPAHTPVPEYIRMIAEGRFTDAYILNRESNVFPGILGRVCDRPCEPACRRGRVEDEPVAICRLKRVAADFKSDYQDRLPEIPKKKNGKKVALIGAGPASLTVANDLMPLGYEVTMFEKEPKGGGAMRFSVPGFRLPVEVLDEEIDTIVNMGVDVKWSTPVTSIKSLLADGYDTVFVGSGAPVGRDLPIDGRKDADKQIFIGLDWLANVAFEHVESIAKNVLVIGGGNTAMDCCRTAKRIGGTNVKVIAPEAYEQMLASPWEKEETEEEEIPILNHLLPQEFVLKDGKLAGVRFQHLASLFNDKGQWDPKPSGKPDEVIPCDAVILAIGQSTAYPFIEQDAGIAFDDHDRVVVNETTYQSSHEKVFFGGDAAFGPKNIIWAVAHGHEAAISMHQFMQKKSVDDRPPVGMNLVSQKMGIHEWSYGNAYAEDQRFKVPHIDLKQRMQDLKAEVELGYDDKLAFDEAQRCLNCDVQTVFSEPACIECDACVDICPVSSLSITKELPIEDMKKDLSAPLLRYPEQALLLTGELPDTGRVMVKDEDLCVHCGLCAERCPTGAWDMQKFTLELPKASDV